MGLGRDLQLTQKGHFQPRNKLWNVNMKLEGEREP